MGRQAKGDGERPGSTLRGRIDRRDFLNCMTWAGTGLLWTVTGGVLTSRAFGATADTMDTGSFSFIQISDSHIGFDKPPNPNPTATLQTTIDRINAAQLKQKADLLVHTGDVTHTSKAEQFDTAK